MDKINDKINSNLAYKKIVCIPSQKYLSEKLDILKQEGIYLDENLIFEKLIFLNKLVNQKIKNINPYTIVYTLIFLESELNFSNLNQIFKKDVKLTIRNLLRKLGFQRKTNNKIEVSIQFTNRTYFYDEYENYSIVKHRFQKLFELNKKKEENKDE